LAATRNSLLFQNAIRREEGFSTVILDLSHVPYIDSTALGALVAANVSLQKAGNVQNHQQSDQHSGNWTAG
jgi:anti-anti-sigma regulatory factor